MAKIEWESERGHPSEFAFTKRARRWGNLSFRKTPWGWVVQTTPKVVHEKSRRVQRLWSDWLFWMNQVFKITHPELLWEYYRQQSISRVQARDIWSASGFGYLLYFELDGGKTMYSVAHRERFSRTLDVFSQDPGSLLVRDTELWVGLPPGPQGSVLVSRGPGQLPQWATLATAGFGGVVLVDIKAPAQSQWTVFREGRAGSSVVWRPYGPVLRSVSGPGTNPTVLMNSSILSAQFDAVVGFVCDFTLTGDQNKGGIAVYDPNADAAVAFTLWNDFLAIQYYYFNFTLEQRVAFRNYRVVPHVLIFLRFEQTQSSRNFYVSSNGVDWIHIFSRPIEHATELLRACVLVDARNAESDFLTHFVHFSLL